MYNMDVFSDSVLILQGGCFHEYMYMVKIAEFTISNADIRGIAIAINNPRRHLARHMMLPNFIAHIHQLCRGRIFK